MRLECPLCAAAVIAARPNFNHAHSTTHYLEAKSLASFLTKLMNCSICEVSDSSDDLDGVARTTFLGSILSRCAVGKNPDDAGIAHRCLASERRICNHRSQRVFLIVTLMVTLG